METCLGLSTLLSAGQAWDCFFNCLSLSYAHTHHFVSFCLSFVLFVITGNLGALFMHFCWIGESLFSKANDDVIDALSLEFNCNEIVYKCFMCVSSYWKGIYSKKESLGSLKVTYCTNCGIDRLSSPMRHRRCLALREKSAYFFIFPWKSHDFSEIPLKKKSHHVMNQPKTADTKYANRHDSILCKMQSI